MYARKLQEAISFALSQAVHHELGHLPHLFVSERAILRFVPAFLSLPYVFEHGGSCTELCTS
jgi:hypothetical protein